MTDSPDDNLREIDEVDASNDDDYNDDEEDEIIVVFEKVCKVKKKHTYQEVIGS